MLYVVYHAVRAIGDIDRKFILTVDSGSYGVYFELCELMDEPGQKIKKKQSRYIIKEKLRYLRKLVVNQK